MDEGGLRDEAHGLLRASELDEPADRVQLVREFVRLRAQRVREVPLAVELPHHPLEIGAIAQRHDRADGLSADLHRHAVRDEHALAGEHDLVGARVRALEHVADTAGGDDVGDEPTLAR